LLHEEGGGGGGGVGSGVHIHLQHHQGKHVAGDFNAMPYLWFKGVSHLHK